MRCALIQGPARTDGQALTLARALRRRQHEVTLLVPLLEARTFVPAFVEQWHAEGFACIPVSSARLSPTWEHFPIDPGLATARALADVLHNFDVAWFFERHWAMPVLRQRRFRTRQLPLIVLDALPDQVSIPSSLSEINRAAASQYVARWADLITTGSAEQDIPQLEALWHARQVEPERTARAAATSPAVTICIPHFEEPVYLSETLQSLERQTTSNFTVVVVDDGSHTPAAHAAFDACEQQYAARGWQFIRQTNQSPGAARNRAASEATTEFLLFLDADDIAMPAMVERLLQAALLSGDDCLVLPNYSFRDDPEGPCHLLYDPPGNSLIGSMADDMHGGSCIFIRSEAFASLGGFSHVPGVGFEDYELHVRCNLAGLRWDVLPDLLYRYRMPRTSSVSRSTPFYRNLAGVLRWYEGRLRPGGLGQLPLAFASIYQHLEKTTEKAAKLEKLLASRHPKPKPSGKEVKLLLLACNFPFGIVSGWHTRVQQMIRHFGSRYTLTLMTAMPREQLAPVRKETFRHLHAVRGVEGSNKSVAVGEDLPFRIRESYTDTFQAALRALPTDQYHAAIIDQLFLAEYRKDIDTVSVLTEHNIESRLLQQAAERSWPGDIPQHFQNAKAEACRLQHYEDQVWPEFPLRSAVSEVDRAYIDSRARRGTTVLAANGADPATWLPNIRFEAATILFPAHLAYLPNVEAIDFLLSEIWPHVIRQAPRARLIIAGRDPADSVRAAVSRAANVELCASPASMQTVARRASIAIAPLRLGSGTRAKILEAMAWGLPVVSTTLGAEGLDAADGVHLLLRDDPADFADAIVRLLADRALWSGLRNAGRDLVSERYSWDRVFEPLENALIELISK